MVRQIGRERVDAIRRAIQREQEHTKELRGKIRTMSNEEIERYRVQEQKRQKELMDTFTKVLKDFHYNSIRVIEHELKSRGLNVKRKNIKKTLDAFDQQQKRERYNFKDWDRKIFANCLGDFQFDIIFSRGLARQSKQWLQNRDKQEYPKCFAIFLHTNSGYVFYYAMNSTDKAHLQAVQRAFNREVKSEFSYPLAFIHSDKQTGWDNNQQNFSKDVVIDMSLDPWHTKMAKINSFASHMRRFIYRKRGNYDIKSQPIRATDFEEFVDFWNSMNVPGMKCTRKEMMSDRTHKHELEYIANSLYGKLKKDEEAPAPLTQNDVIQFVSPYNTTPFGNQQQQKGKVVPGHYRLVSDGGNVITVQNIDNPDDQQTIQKRNVRYVVRDKADEMETYHKKIDKIDDEHRLKVTKRARRRFIVDPEVDKQKQAQVLFNAEQRNWENIGFPSNWNLEYRYNRLKELISKLEPGQQNEIMGADSWDTIQSRLHNKHSQKAITRKLQEKLKTYMIQTNNPFPWPREQNISRTDGDERSEHIKKLKGRIRQLDGIIPDDRKEGEPMRTRAKTKKNKF